ncbi:MAG: hypothetical protein HY078_10735 [Elusimicrobia bacterium]|nr:hypothetical protein [Elusimicrobiota bacterium]
MISALVNRRFPAALLALVIPAAALAGTRPAASPAPLILEIRQAASAGDRDKLAALCERLRALRADHAGQPGEDASRHLAEADGVLQDSQSCAQAVPASPPLSAVAPEVNRDVRSALRRASESASMFDGAKRRIAPEPVTPPRSSVEGYLSAVPAQRLTILRQSASDILKRAMIPDADGAKAELLSTKLEERLNDHPKRPEFANLDIVLDAERRLVLNYQDKRGAEHKEILGALEEWIAGADGGAASAGGARQAKKPKVYCKSNLDGYLGAADAAAKREVLERSSALLFKRAGLADEDGKKAACFSDKLEEFLSKQKDLVCVRTTAEAGNLKLTYSDKPNVNAVEPFGKFSELSCGPQAAPAAPPAAAETPDTTLLSPNRRRDPSRRRIPANPISRAS